MKKLLFVLFLPFLFITAQAQEEIFTIVENQPEFPGGNEELYKYLGENLKYPSKAIDKNIQGRVYVSFVVEKDGTITGVKVLRGIGSGCDEEAIRVTKEMPTWSPGRQRGKTVRVRFNLPIVFKLDDGESKSKKKQKKQKKEKGGW